MKMYVRVLCNYFALEYGDKKLYVKPIMFH